MMRTFTFTFALFAASCVSVSLHAADPIIGTQPRKLQPMSVRDGVLYFADGNEVKLWGVNFQACLSWEHSARMARYGLFMPLKAEEMKRMTDESFDQIQRLGSDVIRIHLCPADFCDGEGKLVERIWLDLLDYTMAEARKRGIYVSLSLIRYMKSWGKTAPNIEDCFANKYRADEWIVVPEAVQSGRRYIQSLLMRVNPYDHTRYCDNPALALIEPINEPHCTRREDLANSPLVNQAYQDWLKAKGRTDDDQTFDAFRYDTTRSYIDGTIRVIREQGAKQPVVWSCCWPRNIIHNEEVFRAIADSQCDVVSYCLYPGQDVLKVPYWDNSLDLTARDYSPFLKKVITDEGWLGWTRTERFKSKAKIVYEFEALCNMSTAIFPAMAKVFRSTGAQVATQWTYGLSGYEAFTGGTHVMNLETTPGKAASFMVAGEMFRSLPRGLEFKTTSAAADEGPGYQWSHTPNLSLATTEHSLIHAAPLPSDIKGLPQKPTRIVGLGDSPFISYSGTGLYFLDQIAATQYSLTILPNVRYLSPHWKAAVPGKPSVELDRTSSLPFRLHLPNQPKLIKVERKAGAEWEDLPFDGDQFAAMAGEYRITLQTPGH